MGAFQANGMLTIGMTGHAQELLGGLVFIELPDVSKGLAARREAVAIESVKAAADDAEKRKAAAAKAKADQEASQAAESAAEENVEAEASDEVAAEEA